MTNQNKNKNKQLSIPGQGGSSPLSLLVNAVDSRDGATARGAVAAAAAPAGAFQDRTLAESVLRRGLPGESVGPLHEELMRQKQAEGLRQAAVLHAQQPNGSAGAGLLQQLSESQQLSHQLAQQLSQSDIRSALASAQLRQTPQLSNADLMALARSGTLPGLGGFLGGGLAGLAGGAGGGGGIDQRLGELELQGLEELELRQRLLAAGLPNMSCAGQLMAPAPAVQSQAQGSEPSRSEPESAQSASAPAPAVNRPANGQDAPSMGMGRSNFPGEAGGLCRATPPASSGDKKDQRRDPGSVVVPCRARGMPMDHNFKTAYFVIPENVRHGEELICSYYACRNAGVKFRYCSHCKVPVAKRNFRKRHRHGDNDKSKGIVDDDDDSVGEGSRSEENGDVDMDDVPTHVTAKMPAQQSGKTTAKELHKSSPILDIVRTSAQHLSAQQQLQQQLNATQLNARQQLNAPQLSARPQNALQQLSAQQQKARHQQLKAQQQNSMQQLTAQQQQNTLLQQQHALQQQLTAQQTVLQQQLGGHPLSAQKQNALQQQLDAKPQHELGSLGGMPGHVAAVAQQQPRILIGGAGSLLGAFSRGGADGNRPSLVEAGGLAASLPVALVCNNPAVGRQSETFSVPFGENRERMLLERTDLWLQLLVNRPHTTDADSMSAWLLEILTVSDLTLPASNSSTATAGKESVDKDGSSEENPNEDDDEEDEEEDEDENQESGHLGEDDEEEDCESSGDGGNEKYDIDKKRPLDHSSAASEGSDFRQSGNSVEAGYSVSFAEWRDRKKQKKSMRKK